MSGDVQPSLSTSQIVAAKRCMDDLYRIEAERLSDDEAAEIRQRARDTLREIEEALSP